MSATNAHRLGANEAPPAIISIFMGSQIAGILERIEHSTNAELTNLAARKELELNLSQIPEIMRDNTTATALRPLPSPATGLNSAPSAHRPTAAPP